MKSQELSHISPRDARPMEFAASDCKHYRDLRMIGISLDEGTVRQMMREQGFAMDAIQGTITTGSIPNPVQFLQNWLPGQVNVITQVRNIDELVGITTTGAWEDEEIIQTIAEPTGKARPYGDLTNLPLASYNLNYERRTIVRFENGIMVGKLEDARASRANANSAALKREGATNSLEIARNSIGFNGYNAGANRTYGFLNDPNLPAYVNVSGGVWSAKTFDQITADIRVAVSALILRSGGNIDPTKVNTTLAVPTNLVVYLSTTTSLGMSVQDWLTKSYPKMRVVSAPELYQANGGASVFYLYAETVPGSGSDDGRVFIQPVPTKFQILGVEKKVKGYEEGYTNATAGVLLKRPWAVVRYSGI